MKRGRGVLILVSAGLLLGLDRWLKDLAINGLAAGVGFVRFAVLKNYGIVFSWPLPGSVALALMFVGTVVVLWTLWRAWQSQDERRLWAASLMAVGAASNLFDRLAHGFIIDWAYLGRWWPVFNAADVLIVVGLWLYLTAEQKSVD